MGRSVDNAPQDGLFTLNLMEWGTRESNPYGQLGKLELYH